MLSEYLLVIAMYQGGVTTVPQTYPDKKACDIAGHLWVTSLKVDSIPMGNYVCLTKYKQRSK